MGLGEPRRGEGLIFFRSAPTAASFPEGDKPELALCVIDRRVLIAVRRRPRSRSRLHLPNRLHSHTKNRSWLNSVFSKRALQWTSPSKLTVL